MIFELPVSVVILYLIRMIKNGINMLIRYLVSRTDR